MTLTFLHLPKTGGTSVDVEISRILSDNSLSKLSIHRENINKIKNNHESFFEGFDYIHIHACGYTGGTRLSFFLENNRANNFTILRYPADHIMSLWRHSLQISPQILPRNESLPAFHQRFKSLESLIHLVSPNGYLDYDHALFGEYFGLKRLFAGQMADLQVSMGCGAESVLSMTNYFLLEDPDLSAKLKLLLENNFFLKTDFQINHLNKTRAIKNCSLSHQSLKCLSVLHRDLKQYLKIARSLD